MPDLPPIERYIDAPPDVVFDQLVEPERLRRWLVMNAWLDLRAGGDYRFDMSAGTAGGSFLEVEEAKRLVFTWGWHDSETMPPGSSTVTIELSPVGDGTRLVFTHTDGSPDDLRAHVIGWSHYLDRLVTLAESGRVAADDWEDAFAHDRSRPFHSQE